MISNEKEHDLEGYDLEGYNSSQKYYSDLQ